MKTEILKKLENLAYKRTTPFCMSCYIKAPQGKCSSCQTDDLAHWMDGVGLDWSLDFAIKHILQEKFTPVETDELFEEMICSCYPEITQVGWMNFDTCELMKSQDPISWAIACDEYIQGLEEDGEIISFDNCGTYYKISDLVELLE
jgi:hypothetical protein